MSHKQENLVLAASKISVTTSPPTSGHLAPQIAILFNYCVRRSLARDQWNSGQHQRWTEGKDNSSIYQI